MNLPRSLDPDLNRPTLGALVVAFLTALVTWGLDLIPATVPDNVITTGYILVVAVAAVVVGKITQQFGDHAPWADPTHRDAIAYALSLNPNEHSDELLAALEYVGVSSVEEVKERIGLPADYSLGEDDEG